MGEIERVKLLELAKLEASQKGRIYPKGTCYFRKSAVDGIVNMLKEDGEIKDSNVVIIPLKPIPTYYLREMVQMELPKFMERHKQNINLESAALEKLYVYIHKDEEDRKKANEVIFLLQEITKQEENCIEALKDLKKRQLEQMFI